MRIATRHRSTWLVVAVLAGLLAGVLAPAAGALNVVECGKAEAPACMGSCPAGQLCFAISRGDTTICSCRAVGCCRTVTGTCTDNVPALTCLAAGGTWGRSESCESGCEPTGDPNGSSCTDAGTCQSDNCADGVCCNTPCDGPNQVCNSPGRVGECATVPAVAPAASRVGLLLIAAALVAVAAVALLRRRVR